MTSLRCLLTALLLAAAAIAAAQPAEDPFRYLEDAGDARTRDFMQAEAAKARAALDRIPGREALLKRIQSLSQPAVAVSDLAWGGARLFYLKDDPRRGLAICWREGVAGPERVLLDASRFERAGDRPHIDWMVPSPDGQHVAFGLSFGGAEDSVLRVAAVEGNRLLPFEIDRARFNAGLAWQPDGRAFHYARIPEGNAGARRYAGVRLYRHVLGRPTDQDEIVFAAGVGGARDVADFEVPSILVPPESRFAYAVARERGRPELAVHVAEAKELAAGKPRWRRLVSPADEVLAVAGLKDELLLLSRRGSPRHRVLRVKGSLDLSAARVMIAEGDTVIRGMAVARDALYLRTMVAGVDRLERLPLGFVIAHKPEFVRIPFDNAISELVASPRVDGALLRLEGWIDAPSVLQVDKRGDAKKLDLQPPPAASFAEMDEVRLYAPAPDGTKIPVTLVYRKSTKLDGFNPTILLAYGSFGEPYAPNFDPARLAWLERGGVIAVAHVRGGGENGSAWHLAGRRANKATTVGDLIACAEFIVGYGFTQPRRLALQARGAGAVAASGALARRPELFAAGIGRAPLLDLVRADTALEGPGEIAEFGSTATPEGLEALRALSPYHQVRDDVAYPAVLMLVGANDARVPAWHAAKMAARLQAAGASARPVLLRVDPASGHGPGTSRPRRDEALADIYSFALWQMGEEGFQPRALEATPLAPAPAPTEIAR